MLAREKEKSRSPFTEKLIRPAGESLRLRVDELREEMMEPLFRIVVFLVAPCIVAMVTPSARLGVHLVLVTLVFVTCWLLAWRDWRGLRNLREKLRNVRLGFDGERFVATELNGLLSQGYRVFHDFIVDWVPDDQRHNIDHIVVGPTGVFAIETKAWRKPLGVDGEMKLRVSDEGIQLPGDKPRKNAIQQARRNAATLSRWLTGSASEKIPVRPLVVVPGWYVDAPGWKTCGVQTLRGLAGRFPGLQRHPDLSPQEVQQFGDRIEAHCRTADVAN